MFWTEPLIYNTAACVLTVIIECGLFFAFKYRKPQDLAVIALANVVTNVALNLFLELVPDAFEYPWIFILELIVIEVEYLIFRRAFGPSKKLILLTTVANVLSFAVGVLVYEIF